MLESKTIKFKILTIFPSLVSGYFSNPKKGVIARAVFDGKIKIDEVNLRDFAFDKHKTTDDRMFGGGPGMVMKIEPIFFALKSIIGEKEIMEKINSKRKKVSELKKEGRIIIGLDARGKKLTQNLAFKLSKFQEIIVICGRYQGIDERVLESLTDINIRIGDSIVSGGESLAIPLIESVSRLIPGVLGNEESIENETFTKGGFPVYTHPREFFGMRIPEVLLSGDHKKIDEFRKSFTNKKTK